MAQQMTYEERQELSKKNATQFFINCGKLGATKINDTIIEYKNIQFYVYHDSFFPDKFELSLHIPTEKRDSQPNLGYDKNSNKITLPRFSGTVGNEHRLFNRIDTQLNIFAEHWIKTEENYLKSKIAQLDAITFKANVQELLGEEKLGYFTLFGNPGASVHLNTKTVTLKCDLTLEQFEALLNFSSNRGK